MQIYAIKKNKQWRVNLFLQWSLHYKYLPKKPLSYLNTTDLHVSKLKAGKTNSKKNNNYNNVIYS